MLDERNLRKSLMAYARGLLQSPPAAYTLTPYQVNDEEHLRQAIRKEFEPPPRNIFLVDSYVRPVSQILPLVVVEVPEATFRPYELGNRSGARYEAYYHVFGKDRGERDDLSTFLAKNLAVQVPIYDYSTSGSAALIEYAVIEDEVTTSNMEIRVDGFRQEGTLDLWKMLHFFLLTKN